MSPEMMSEKSASGHGADCALDAGKQQIGVRADDPRVVAALEEYLEAVERGAVPNRHEFLVKHGEIAEVLRGCLDGMDWLHGAAREFEVEKTETLPIPPAFSLHGVMRLGDYRILREVGRGGMGIVYEAIQESLGRRVALKVLPLASALDPRQRQRFRVEAQAAAHLHHTHIVPVFSIGSDQGIDYYAMQFIDGRTLADLIRDLRSFGDVDPEALEGEISRPVVDAARSLPLESGRLVEGEPTGGSQSAITALPVDGTVVPLALDSKDEDHAVAAPAAQNGSGSGSFDSRRLSSSSGSNRERPFFRSVARLGQQAADALDHAHSLGVLHRDIKPANLMIDLQGNLWITDFGLARFQQDLGLTFTGDLLGTLRYMSPEQALGRRVVIDHRADLYSLGVTLYELVTLRPAFDGGDRASLLRQIENCEPVPPRRLNPWLPRDLETVILKAMSKDPAQRYASASELSADLQRFLDDKPILARRPTMVEIAARWARRHKTVVAASGVFVLLLTVGLCTANIMLWREQSKTTQTVHKAFEKIEELLTYLDDPESIATSRESERIETLKLATSMIKFYEDLTQQHPKDLDARYKKAKAYHRVGEIRSAMANTVALGDDRSEQVHGRHINQALVAYQQSEKILRSLVVARDDARYRAELVQVLNNEVSLSLHHGDFTNAKRAADEALALADELVAAEPRNMLYLRYRGDSFIVLGDYFGALGNQEMMVAGGMPRRKEGAGGLSDIPARGEEHLQAQMTAYRRAEELLATVQKETPNDEALLQSMVRLQTSMAQMHRFSHIGKADRTPERKAAQAAFGKADLTLRQLLSRSDDRRKWLTALVSTRENMTCPLVVEPNQESTIAEEFYLKAIDAAQKLAEEYGDQKPGYRVAFAKKHLMLYFFYIGRNQWDRADAVVKKASAVLEELIQEYPEDRTYPESLANLYDSFGKYAMRFAESFPPDSDTNAEPSLESNEAARRATVRSRYARALALLERGVKADPNYATAKNDLAWYLVIVPETSLRDSVRAESLIRAAIAHKSDDSFYWNTLGAVLMRQKRWSESRTAINESVRLSKETSGQGIAEDWYLRAIVDWESGDHAEAEKSLRRAEDLAISRYYAMNADALLLRSEAAQTMGRTLPPLSPRGIQASATSYIAPVESQ